MSLERPNLREVLDRLVSLELAERVRVEFPENSFYGTSHLFTKETAKGIDRGIKIHRGPASDAWAGEPMEIKQISENERVLWERD